MTSSCTEVDSTFAAMLRQEKDYVGQDYLSEPDQNDPPESVSAINGPLHEEASSATSTLEQDRAKMVEWQYQVADFCRFDRETVAIATNYFDRFLATSSAAEAHTNTDLFQLAVMACFYTAAKIHEPESFEPWMLSKMSRGLYLPSEVETMERVILQAIEWRMNPPTALSFIKEFMEMLPACYLSDDVRPTVMNLAKFQVELSVRIYQFVPVKASTIALAALLNAFESIGMDDDTLSLIKTCIFEETGIKLVVDKDVQHRLYQTITALAATHTEISTSTTHVLARQIVCESRRGSAYNISPAGVSEIYTIAT